MKIKTTELIDSALDWAVAKAVGHGVTIDLCFGKTWSPSTNWAQCGPLIEFHRICIERSIRGTGYDCGQPWSAWVSGWEGLYRRRYGQTLLIAVCRTIVAAKLGDEVNIPDELIPAAPTTIVIEIMPTGFRNGDVVCSLPDSEGGEA